MTWNGIMRSLVIDPETSPELFKELSHLKVRARGERIRTLALLGIVALNGGKLAVKPNESESEKNNTAATRKALRDKLAKGFSAS